MTQFRPTAPQTQAGHEAVQAAYAEEIAAYRYEQLKAAVRPAEESWRSTMIFLIRREIDQGRLVRVALPGAQVPILVEDAEDWAQMLVIVDPQGRRYYVGHPAGVVVLCDPVPPPDPNAMPFWMTVDEPSEGPV